MNAHHEEFVYRYSRSHATAELLDALRGIGPALGPGRGVFGPRTEDSVIACGERVFPFATRVYAVEVRPEVTCPKCRALMRAIRPESAPLYEVRLASAGYPVGYVGGEQMERMPLYEERVA